MNSLISEVDYLRPYQRWQRVRVDFASKFNGQLRTTFEEKGLFCSIINDLVFEKTRKVLQSKQKQLRKQGKGNKPKASVALTSEELKILYEKGLLGMCSTEALLNTLWLNKTLHFGLCGCKEHRDMCWGDHHVKVHKAANGVEYLEFNERRTKTRTGSDYSNVRAVPPKLFATEETERDSVAVHKFFARKRPAEMNQDDAPYYLAVNNGLKADPLARKSWSGAVGRVNKLNGLMKTMFQKAGIEKRQTSKSQLQKDNDPGSK